MDASRNTDEPDAWRTIENPVEGVLLTFLQTAQETAGARIVLLMVVAPGGGVNPEVHTKFTESYEVLEGTLAFELGGSPIRLAPGTTVSAPPGTLHSLRNDTGSPVTVRVTAAPGNLAERGLRAYFGLCRDGLVTQAGMPKNPFVGAIILNETGTYFPPLPVWLSRVLFAALAAIGRRMGGDKVLARYLEPPSQPSG